MQESRLFRMLYYLLDKKQVTAYELSKKLEVSLRTIYRDLDVISQAGIPIYTTVGRSGGISIQEGYTLHHLLLSDEEKQLLLQSIQQLQTIGVQNQEETLHKLCALFQMDVPRWLHVDFSQWGTTTVQMDITLLKQAILQHETISFIYINANGEEQTRIVHPIMFVYKSMAWYLQAYCEQRQAIRNFKLHRMHDVKNLHKTFSPYDPIALKPYSQGECIPVTLRCTKERAYRIYDEFAYDTITKQADGTLIIQADMPDAPWLVSYILSFGHEIEIIQPTALKEKLLQEIELIKQRNTKP